MLSGPSPRAALRGATARSASRSTYLTHLPAGLDVLTTSTGPAGRRGHGRTFRLDAWCYAGTFAACFARWFS